MWFECVDIKVHSCVFKLILLYLSVNDDSRNEKLIKEAMRLIKQYKGEQILVLGYLNCHFGILGPQLVNKTGQLILNFIDSASLNLLNLDDSCVGEITWKQGNWKSVIDYIMVNEVFYDFLSMIIDEEEILKISDHNLISVKWSSNVKLL